MTRVLVIGYAPEAVDFSDPVMTPGLDKAKVTQGIEDDQRKLTENGFENDHLPIYADNTIRQRIVDQLKKKTYDCIVIGAGVRITTKHVYEFECVINALREAAPDTPIAFNSGPDTSSDAVARWLQQ